MKGLRTAWLSCDSWLVSGQKHPKVGRIQCPIYRPGRKLHVLFRSKTLQQKLGIELKFCHLHVWKRTQYESAQQTTINQQQTLPNKPLTTVSITNTDSLTFQCCNWKKLLSCRDAPIHWPDIGIAITAYRWIRQNSAMPVSNVLVICSHPVIINTLILVYY